MERTNEQPTGQTVTNYATPEKVLQYITSMYNHWVYNDYGIHRITEQIVALTKNSKYLSLCKNKSMCDNDQISWKISETISGFQFEFKGSASLYRESGCASNIVTTPRNLNMIMNQLTQELVTPILSIITTELDKYKPNIKSPQAAAFYNHFLGQFLYGKIRVFPDVTSKKIYLFISK